jgi:hypothetical protein
MSCCTNDVPVLNGFGIRTEGSRMREYEGTTVIRGNDVPCNPYKYTIQAPITPAESSRIAGLIPYASGMVPASRVQMLLAQKRSNYRSEGVRIREEIQALVSCQPAKFNNRTPPLPVCPPLPPPPGPPARVCILAKNQRLF